ncbi:hypothetical protein [uncultured Dokdonia sp.]|uniref:hypothetical protein n=1 Tax=uncultured Dokdonia sp. TaxID=575653 RepID=UPI00261EAB3B|nr:hypothetical protein [uncultured Dokdonia sp.]
MKKIAIVVMCVLATSLYAQRDDAVDANNNVLGALASYGPDGAGVGGSSVVFNPSRPIDGSVHVFDTWRNNAIIQTTGGMTLRLRDNINLNAKRNVFESKIGRDSVFTFDFTNIEKMVVNNKTYKNIFSPVEGGYRLVEVVAETDDFAIYKDYKIDIKEGNPNPMLAQQNDKYVMKDSYYVKKGRSFKKFKLKKSNFLKLAGKKADQLEAYADKNNFNFRDEKDLEKIASYYGTL